MFVFLYLINLSSICIYVSIRAAEVDVHSFFIMVLPDRIVSLGNVVSYFRLSLGTLPTCLTCVLEERVRSDGCSACSLVIRLALPVYPGTDLPDHLIS